MPETLQLSLTGGNCQVANVVFHKTSCHDYSIAVTLPTLMIDEPTYSLASPASIVTFSTLPVTDWSNVFTPVTVLPIKLDAVDKACPNDSDSILLVRRSLDVIDRIWLICWSISVLLIGSIGSWFSSWATIILMKSLMVNSFSRSELAGTDAVAVGVENRVSIADMSRIQTGGRYNSGYIGQNAEKLPVFSRTFPKIGEIGIIVRFDTSATSDRKDRRSSNTVPIGTVCPLTL